MLKLQQEVSLDNIIKDLRHLKIACNSSMINTESRKTLIKHCEDNIIEVESDHGKYSDINYNLDMDDP